jgi:hypothetical protein
VTWERPQEEGANDWVEDPQVFVEDAVFEAAAFARDSYLESVGLAAAAQLTSERARAGSVLKLLRWNGQLEEVVANLPEEEEEPEPKGRRKRRRRKRDSGAPADPEKLPTPLSAVPRRVLLRGYLEGLDLLAAGGVTPSSALGLSVLFAPLLVSHLDRELTKQGRSEEEVADEFLYPIARRHSLARRDRDRIKRSAIDLRRLISGELRRRTRGRDRMLGRDHFRESVVLLWLHCRATNSGFEELRYWEAQVKKTPRQPTPTRKKRRRRRRKRRD